jgi:ribosomal protein L7Ae-like RNA K-turn-binding protein
MESKKFNVSMESKEIPYVSMESKEIPYVSMDSKEITYVSMERKEIPYVSMESKEILEFPKTKLVAVHADVCNFLLPC